MSHGRQTVRFRVKEENPHDADKKPPDPASFFFAPNNIQMASRKNNRKQNRKSKKNGRKSRKASRKNNRK
jgi:hypothetical protein